MTQGTIDWDMVFQTPSQQYGFNEKTATLFFDWKNTRLKNDIEMCIAAAKIKTKGNATSGKGMSKTFRDWWKKHGLDQVFGSKSTFYRYAEIGTFLGDLEKNKRLKKHIAQLPPSVTALKAICDLTEEEFELCLKDTYKRDSIDGEAKLDRKGKNPKPLINPGVKASQIKAWHKKWTNPPQKREDDRILELVTIKGNIENFLAANEDGSDLKYPKLLGMAEEISEAVKKIVDKYDPKNFLVVPNFEKIKSRQDRAKQKAAEKSDKAKATPSPKKAAKKAPAKKK